MFDSERTLILKSYLRGSLWRRQNPSLITRQIPWRGGSGADSATGNKLFILDFFPTSESLGREASPCYF